MGSSAKKKREKKKDFQKAKLKVGKTKAKPTNHTETSFKSKAIVLNQQSLAVTAPSTSSQFQHHVSLVASKSDAQRRESLAYLTTFMASHPVDSPLPQPLSTLLPKLYPLILDGSSSVRTQLLKLFRSLPSDNIEDHVNDVLPYVRAGMTHLAADIRLYAVDVLCWLLEDAGSEVVSCAGGWYKILNCFLTIMGWSTQDAMKWSSNRASFGKSGSEGKPMARILQALAEFVHVGIGQQSADGSPVEDAALQSSFPLWHRNQHWLPHKTNAFGYLNLFGTPKDDALEMLEDREDRRRVFDQSFRGPIEMGLEAARKEGGEFWRQFPTTIALTALQPLEMDPDKVPQRAMSLQDTEYPDLEHGQQQNSQQAARKGAMTMKALSRKLTDEYPAITKLIPGRPLAEKWETTMAAIAQIIAVFNPGEIGNPNTLVFPAVHNQPDGRKLEEIQIAAFDNDTSKFLTPDIIEDLEHVWHIWIETITYASAIGAHVYEKNFYGPPRSIPWIEFIGIAVVITKHYQIYGHDDNADMYATKLILADVSRLRRWLRCKLNSDGFRRSDGDWTVCWDIINETPGDEKTIPAVSAFTVVRKGSTRFHFRDEPELDLVVEQDPESDEEDEAMEVDELTATVEAEDDDKDDDDDDEALEVDQMAVTVGDDSGEELHPKLRGTVTGPVHVEPEDLVGGAVGTERAEYGRVARNDAAKYYPIDNTREFF